MAVTMNGDGACAGAGGGGAGCTPLNPLCTWGGLSSVGTSFSENRQWTALPFVCISGENSGPPCRWYAFGSSFTCLGCTSLTINNMSCSWVTRTPQFNGKVARTPCHLHVALNAHMSAHSSAISRVIRVHKSYGKSISISKAADVCRLAACLVRTITIESICDPPPTYQHPHGSKALPSHRSFHVNSCIYDGFAEHANQYRSCRLIKENAVPGSRTHKLTQELLHPCGRQHLPTAGSGGGEGRRPFYCVMQSMFNALHSVHTSMIWPHSPTWQRAPVHSTTHPVLPVSTTQLRLDALHDRLFCATICPYFFGHDPSTPLVLPCVI